MVVKGFDFGFMLRPQRLNGNDVGNVRVWRSGNGLVLVSMPGSQPVEEDGPNRIHVTGLLKRDLLFATI